MINSRKLEDLTPECRILCQKLIDECQKIGIDILVTSTYRDIESQNALYEQGRSKPGAKVTNAKGGQSFHQYRIAFDVVPIENGKPMWNSVIKWAKIGKIGRELGLEWAGTWKTFPEMPHFQMPGYRIVDSKLVKVTK